MTPPDLLASPHALAWIATAPCAFALLWTLDRLRGKRLLRDAGPRAETLARGVSTRLRAARRALVAGGLVLAGVAAAGPRWGEGPETLPQRGLDLIVCLDVSRSMLAQDAEPTRLGAAVSAVAELAEHARGDRFGLVLFAGEARVAVPLTRDAHTFTEIAAGAGPLSVTRGGTDLGAALDAALSCLSGSAGDHEAVLLLTDGEDQDGRALRAATDCAERGIVVHCVGFGSRAGGKIPLENGAGFVTDRQGRDVVTAMDETSLRRLAGATGGAFVAAADEPSPLVAVYDDEIAPLVRKAFEETRRSERIPRFQWPLLGVLALWILDLCLTDRIRR